MRFSLVRFKCCSDLVCELQIFILLIKINGSKTYEFITEYKKELYLSFPKVRVSKSHVKILSYSYPLLLSQLMSELKFSLAFLFPS